MQPHSFVSMKHNPKFVKRARMWCVTEDQGEVKSKQGIKRMQKQTWFESESTAKAYSKAA